MGWIIGATESELDQSWSERTSRIEADIGNRAKRDDLTGYHQADDQTSPATWSTTVYSRTHNHKKQEERANDLHGSCYKISG